MKPQYPLLSPERQDPLRRTPGAINPGRVSGSVWGLRLMGLRADVPLRGSSYLNSRLLLYNM